MGEVAGSNPAGCTTFEINMKMEDKKINLANAFAKIEKDNIRVVKVFVPNDTEVPEDNHWWGAEIEKHDKKTWIAVGYNGSTQRA